MKLCSSQTPRKRDSAWSWLVCVSGSLALALIFAFTSCFAIIMPVFMEMFKESKAKTAWAGSITMGLTFFAMPFSTVFINRTSFRIAAVVGGLMTGTSLVITSFTENLLQVFFSYSVLYGLGLSLIFTANIVAVTNYFDKRQSVGFGILTAGQNIGTVALGPVLQILIDLYGLRWMYRIIAASFILPIVLLSIAYDPNVEKSASHHGNDSEAEESKQNGFTCANIMEVFKSPAYVIAITSLFLQALTCFISYVHLISYCIEVNIEPQRASRLFIAIGVSSMVSCVVCGRIMDIKTVNPFHVSQAGALSMGLSMLLLQLATEYYHFIIYSVFLGLGLGTFFTTVIVLLLKTVDIRLSLVAFSLGQCFTSIGNTTGPPLVGFIADIKGSYKPAFFTAGGIMLFAFVIPFLQYCFKPWRKLPIDHVSVDVTIDMANGVESNDVIKFKQRNDGGLEEIVLKNLNSDLPESHINVTCVEENKKSHEDSEDIGSKDANNEQKPVEMDDGETGENFAHSPCINDAFEANEVEANKDIDLQQDRKVLEDTKEDLNTRF